MRSRRSARWSSAARRSRRRWRRGGVGPEQVDYVVMGQVLQAGQGQITARQAAALAGVPMSVPALDDQQGVPVGLERGVPRRPDDPGGRRRDRRRRRHGVDDERAVPAAEGAGRLPDGQRRARRLADQGRPVVRVRRGPHGHRHGALQRPGRRARPARRWTTWRPRATSGPPRRRRRGASPTRSRRCRSPSARATRSSSRTTRGCGPRRPPSRSAALKPAFEPRRHDHRRERVPDLRRRGRDRRHEPARRPRSCR